MPGSKQLMRNVDNDADAQGPIPERGGIGRTN
jgi:hypothetical protein